MEEASGQELGWFFEQWLTRRTDPFLDGSWSYDAAGKKITLTIAQTQPGAPFRLPLEVAISADSGAVRLERVELTGQKQVFTFPATDAPSGLALDPNSWILMEPPRLTRATGPG
jgi:aminopeptidase N